MNRFLTDALTVLSSMLLCTACSYDMEFAEPSGPTASVTPSVYLQIDFNTQESSSTRAASDPKGGDTGDGEEAGQTPNENAITSAAVFLYESETGVNDENAGTIPVTSITFHEGEIVNMSEDDTYAISVAKDVSGLSLEKEYHVIAVANPDSSLSTLRTLSEVRDFVETAAWTESDGSYSKFLMTSEKGDETVTFHSYNDTKANPAVVSVDVERMAARVDYRCYNDGTFTIDDGNYYEGATVKITGAVLVNNLTSGSYLLKRVYDITNGTTYLGKEEIGDNENTATNYVIDPWTNYKTGGTVDGLTYGTPYPGKASTDDQEDPSYWEKLVKEGDPIYDDDGETWNRIGYTLENTTYAEYTSKEYATGAVFGAVFYPKSGTVVASFYNTYDYGDASEDEAPGTFFKWNETLYATAEDMMAAAYPASGDGPKFTTDKFDNTTEYFSSWDDVSKFAETLRDDDPTGYKAYLKWLVNNKGTTESLSSFAITWDDYMGEVCGYKCDKGSVSLDKFTGTESIYSSTRAALAALTYNAVSTYEKGQCYYTWWIRHCNNGDSMTNGVMEYAIVRNNIYKLTVEAVSTIGGDIPQEGIQVDVEVEDWVYDSTHNETVDF
ncbi:MAG: Mfa1 family fimbria major subunit [Prevotellaceae bacterium]|nr:Mfa1 family fimbria major subunit [Prevotellaceae bacterium]